jgi:hypothetical protein
MQYRFCLPLIMWLVLYATSYTTVSFAGQTSVRRGDTVILIAPLSDGVTYKVQTPNGIEMWKDRDLYHFAGIQETCPVLQSYGSEVLLYVPIMNAKYWFTVLDR